MLRDINARIGKVTKLLRKNVRCDNGLPEQHALYTLWLLYTLKNPYV